MEMLTYSLWFTLVWWLIWFFGLIVANNKNIERGKGYSTNFEMVYGNMIFIPAIAILLEYLMVR